MDIDIPGDPGQEVDNPDLEVDNEVEDTLANGLKRSSSAPLINQLVNAEQDDPQTGDGVLVRHRHHPHHPLHAGGSGGHLGGGGGVGGSRPAALAYLPGASRWRRWSTSVSPVSPIGWLAGPGGAPPGSGSGQTGWARINRLKVEETGDLGKSEIATEREVQRELSLEKTLSQSCEDLSLSENKETRGRKRHVGGGNSSSTSTLGGSSGGGGTAGSTTDPMLPLTIGVGPFPSPRTSPSPSPSPTRSTGGTTGKQCYSPSMQMPVPTNLSFTPSPSSSPTRRSWASRRSLSPITLRSSQLGPVKRKCMLDDGESTPSKRHSSNLLITHTSRAAPYKIPYPSNWSTPQPSPRPPSETSRENSPVPPGGGGGCSVSGSSSSSLVDVGGLPGVAVGVGGLPGVAVGVGGLPGVAVGGAGLPCENMETRETEV